MFHGRGLATANGIDLIAAIYDAALDSERWPLVLDRLAETLGASAGTLIRQNLITAKGKMIATRVDPKFGQLYNDHYSSLNILPNRAGRPPVGTCLTDRMIVRREEFVRTEFYSDFMRPWGFIISSVLKVHIFMEGDYEIYVSFGRSAKYGEWEPSHLELLRRFAPHLHRTAAVSAILSGSRATIGSLAAAVATVGFAVFLVTEDCRILFANAKAEIISGDGLRAAAKKLKITEATARTHAKHIFDKTRTHRQADLIRSFFEASLPDSPSNV